VSLEKWKSPAFKLNAVPTAHLEEILKQTEQWRTLSKQRSKIETDVKASTPSVKKPLQTKIELPKTPIKHPEIKKTPPPHPVLPKVLPKPPPHKEKTSLDSVSAKIELGEIPYPQYESIPRSPEVPGKFYPLPWPAEPRFQFVNRRD